MATSLELQRDLCREVTGVLGAERIRGYHRAHAGLTLFALGHVWIAIVLGFATVAWLVTLPLWIAWLPGLAVALFMATRINALNVVVHEGAHHALAASNRLNALLTNWGAGYWILFDEDSYRALHGRHHSLLNEPTDPELPLYRISRDRRAIAWGLLADFAWISLVRRALVYREHGLLPTLDPEAADRGAALSHLASKLAANALLVGSQWWLHGPIVGSAVYLLFWVVPLFSFYPMIIRLRIITEHFAPEVFDPSSRGVFVARTSLCGPVEHYLFGAQMDYHFEHHLFPGIPYPQLKRMHADLVERGFFEDPAHFTVEHSLSGGYFRYWRTLLGSDYFSQPVPGLASPS